MVLVRHEGLDAGTLQVYIDVARGSKEAKTPKI